MEPDAYPARFPEIPELEETCEGEAMCGPPTEARTITRASGRIPGEIRRPNIVTLWRGRDTPLQTEKQNRSHPVAGPPPHDGTERAKGHGIFSYPCCFLLDCDQRSNLENPLAETRYVGTRWKTFLPSTIGPFDAITGPAKDIDAPFTPGFEYVTGAK